MGLGFVIVFLFYFILFYFNLFYFILFISFHFFFFFFFIEDAPNISNSYISVGNVLYQPKYLRSLRRIDLPLGVTPVSLPAEQSAVLMSLGTQSNIRGTGYNRERRSCFLFEINQAVSDSCVSVFLNNN